MRNVPPETGAPELKIAEEQPEYHAITAASYVATQGPTAGAHVLLTRWTFTDEERQAIAQGEDLYLAMMTDGSPVNPLHVQVGPDGWLATPGEAAAPQ